MKKNKSYKKPSKAVKRTPTMFSKEKRATSARRKPRKKT